MSTKPTLASGHVAIHRMSRIARKCTVAESFRTSSFILSLSTCGHMHSFSFNVSFPLYLILYMTCEGITFDLREMSASRTSFYALLPLSSCSCLIALCMTHGVANCSFMLITKACRITSSISRSTSCSSDVMSPSYDSVLTSVSRMSFSGWPQATPKGTSATAACHDGGTRGGRLSPHVTSS